MCGIAGLISHSSAIEAKQIELMTKTLRHRGPNDEGYLAFEPGNMATINHYFGRPEFAQTQDELFDPSKLAPQRGYFGHTRLSIIDTSVRGHQPMTAYGRWLVFNGEIYNYLELAKELTSYGYKFNSSCDTEVILAAFDRWGQDCTQRFNGDWSFCIYDPKDNKLFLSRDRFGIKPLYFYFDDNFFAFASEIKSILSLPAVRGQVDRQRIVEDLLFSVIDYDSATLYQEIKQVNPGFNLSLDLSNFKLSQAKYYTLHCTDELGRFSHVKANAYIADIKELLFDAIRLRLRADVPIGACLSGGLDSSAIVAVMQQIRTKEGISGSEHTFTVSFPGTRIDEAVYAQEIADYCKTKHHVVLTSEDDFRLSLQALLEIHDEPFGGASTFAQHAVYKEAARFVTVALDGQGADEVFSGYRNLRVAYLANLAQRGHLIKFCIEVFGVVKQQRKFSKIFAELKSLPFFILPFGLRWRLFQILHKSLSSEFLELSDHNWKLFQQLFQQRFNSNVNELLSNYILRSSLPHLLKYADRNSMAHSVEARVPFTDHRLVDYLFSVPACYKIRNGWTKWLLRKSVEDILPKNIVWRTDKLGFAAPHWATKQDLYQWPKDPINQGRTVTDQAC